MSEPDVEFRVAAESEVIEALTWYEARSCRAADRFDAELRSTIRRIAQGPRDGAFYDRDLGVRVMKLQHFPYLVLYRMKAGVIEILAVAHARRKPGYWKNRLSN